MNARLRKVAMQAIKTLMFERCGGEYPSLPVGMTLDDLGEASDALQKMDRKVLLVLTVRESQALYQGVGDVVLWDHNKVPLEGAIKKLEQVLQLTRAKRDGTKS